MRKKGRRLKRCFCFLFFWGGDRCDRFDRFDRGDIKKIDCLVVFGDEITLLLM